MAWSGGRERADASGFPNDLWNGRDNECHGDETGSEPMNGWVLAGTTFLAAAVEAVEALTVILAVGYTRSWRAALTGAASALGVLTVLVVVFGSTLVAFVPLTALKLAIGIFLLLFGLAWLRKALLRYSGLKALHDEDAIYAKTLATMQAGAQAKSAARAGFATSFNAVLLEGFEVIVIVISFGASMTGGFVWSGVGAALAVLMLAAAAFAIRTPFSRIPENTLKFVVGIMLTAFGTLWTGEGLGIGWWRDDLSLTWIIVSYLLISAAIVLAGKRSLGSPVGEASR
jgi:Ca2+/H+ antiporter, TMEM165/GDT1 family